MVLITDGTVLLVITRIPLSRICAIYGKVLAIRVPVSTSACEFRLTVGLSIVLALALARNAAMADEIVQ